MLDIVSKGNIVEMIKTNDNSFLNIIDVTIEPYKSVEYFGLVFIIQVRC